MEVVVAFAVATFFGLLALWVSARRAITICVLEIVDGEIEVSRGSLTPRILSDMGDIAKRPKVKSATIRLLRARDFAKVDASGPFTVEQLQQLRNVVGNIPIAKLVGNRRTQGQR